jgi:hypothetical protein
VSHRPKRLGALVAAAAAAALVVTGTVGGAVAPAHAAKGPNGAAGWLGNQLTEGLVYNGQFQFNDYGLTADVGIALDRLGGQPGKEAAVRKAMARNVESYITGVDFGSTDRYAGQTAKALVLAQVTGGNPRAFGGVNLVTRLGSLTKADGTTAGRIRDRGASDYSNSIGQGFAARGLSIARSPKAADAVSFLLKQQCSEGFFRLGFAPEGKRRQSCDQGSKTLSVPDTDATALAVINLSAIGKKSPAVKQAIADGIGWLRKTQKKDGSFGGGPTTEGSNSNSTGLAAWALGENDACTAAAKAATWVGKLQQGRGAIAYDRAAFNAGRDGISTAEKDQWRRATAQAAPGLVYRSAAACRG